MTRELSIQESFDWLRSTLEQLSSIPLLSEDDFAYSVFEVLDVDARSALSDVALDRLVSGVAISDSARSEIQRLRSSFLALVETVKARCDDRWLEVARSSERILSKYVPKDTA